MIDVNVDISGIVMCCDESVLGLNIGHGYMLSKKYLSDLNYRDKITDARGNLNVEYMGSRLERDKITDARGNLNVEYMGSRLEDEGGEFFICLCKHGTFQIEGYNIEPNVVIPISGPMCSEQLKPYQEAEMSYLYEVFSLLHIFRQGNIGLCNVFFDYSYRTLGIMGNTVHSNSYNRSRNIVDQRKYVLTPDEKIMCNQFLLDNCGRVFTLLKPCIDEFIWGIEQIDVPTGFEQFTTALEMLLLEKNAQGKKQKLANRISVLIGSDNVHITTTHQKMLDFYRFRSESLHEGNGQNISDVELRNLESITRVVLNKCMARSKSEVSNHPAISWEEIKDKIINDLVVQITTLKTLGVLPT